MFWVRGHPCSVSRSPNRAREVVLAGLAEQSSNDGLLNSGLGADVRSASHLLAGPRAYFPASSATTGANVSAKSAPTTK